MIEVVKAFIILAILLILAYPILPFRSKAKRFSTFYALRYEAPHNKKNLPFLILTIAEFALLAVLFGAVSDATRYLGDLPLMRTLLGYVSSQVQFDAVILVSVVVVNFLILYAFVFFKGFLKNVVFDRVWGLAPKKKKRKKKATTQENEEGATSEGETAEDGDGEDEPQEDGEEESPEFLHTEEETVNEADKDKADASFGARLAAFFCYPFFRGEGYRYARPWVIRTVSVLQTFIYVVEVAYFVLFAGLLCAIFYPMPAVFYDILMKVVPNIFLYPFVSLIFLQEICNTLRAEIELVKVETDNAEEEQEKQDKARKMALKRLHADLVRRYTDTHKLRYFEVSTAKNIPEYQATNVTYEKALNFVRKNMLDTSGHVVESYMRGVDALLNDNNVYFGASFYSELGEYLITYTYVRLLSGERQIFVVSTREEVESLKKFIGRRLNKFSGCSERASWRIRDGSERLDQADILIAVPEDFRKDNIVENNPVFFENTCNAIFIDADKILNLDSYLCTIIANRLRNATGREICFAFLTTHICQGLVKSLKKFFKTTKDIVECNSADENEDVTFMLWNCETDAIYERNGQRVETPEMLIATAAYEAGIDGIRMMTPSPLSVEKMVTLRAHRVEINEMKKEVPDINYMICVDDRFNLASAIYAYTRFRGKKASMVHILSKPYLLREYFSSKAKEYVNRSAFIKPRVTEHADEQKLLLLDLFCDATRNAEGMKLSEYTDRMKGIIKAYTTPEVYQKYEQRDFPCDDLVGYMLAVLRGKAPAMPDDPYRESNKRYYRLTNSREDRGYLLQETSYIAFLFVEEVFSDLLACNRRVELWLNGSPLGRLDTFPTRLCQQFVPGQSIVYKNCEYEIERIADDKTRLYLRQENVTYKNCLDTLFLRRYDVLSEEEQKSGTLCYTRGTLESICVAMRQADLVGETYGFYNLMSDTQTLDFTDTVVGNPHLSDGDIEKVKRDVKASPLLSVTIKSRGTCNDGMRLLLSAVMNEFLRTMFPSAYRCIAVVPVLETAFEARAFEDDFSQNVAGLYPYLRNRAAGTATDANTIELLIVNDCSEDVGVLDILYDGAARIMEELLSHAYSYLKWLQDTPCPLGGLNHYIYFGAESLPTVFDLDNTVDLLANCAREFVRTDFSSNNQEEEEEERGEKRCAFCHMPLEVGRYSRFSQHRYICISCEAETVAEPRDLERAEKAAKKYMADKYDKVGLPQDVAVKLDGLYKLPLGSVLNEFYYKTDIDGRTVMVERDNPETNVVVSVIHNLVFFWQNDRKYWVGDRYRVAPYLTAQMYYEEFAYLLQKGRSFSVDWLREHIDATLLERLKEIEAYLAANPDKTSFDFIDEKIKEDQSADHGETGEAEMLFDPDKVPRFWKRYLYLDPDAADSAGDENNTASEDEDGEDVFGETNDETAEDIDETAEDSDPAEDVEGVEDTAKNARYEYPLLMAPPPEMGEDDFTVGQDGEDDLTEEDTPPEETPAERRKREKEEKKAQKERERAEKKAKREKEKQEKKAKREQDKLNKRKKKKGAEDEVAFEEDMIDPTIADEDLSDDETDRTPVTTGEGGNGEGEDKDPSSQTPEDPGQPGGGKKKPKEKSKFVRRLLGIKTPEELIPHEPEEDTNPRIRFYNQIARAAFAYSKERVEVPKGLTSAEVEKIHRYVLADYPEIFWVRGWYRGTDYFSWWYRFEKPDGTIDVALIKHHRKELRSSVKFFTKGIGKRTSPYRALLTIYRRVVLAFDYDDVALAKQEKQCDTNQEDELRSLYYALVKRKVVCAGYAVAMQFLLQSVGICCAQITSETHAWNVVKIGSQIYHLDATWGDHSKTTEGEKNQDKVFYNYFCITSEENLRDGYLRQPESYFAEQSAAFHGSRHEYFRYHNAYLTRYDEGKIARILAEGALRKEPCIGFRCATQNVYDSVNNNIKNGRVRTIVEKARELIALKNKRLAKRFAMRGDYYLSNTQYTFHFVDYLDE